MDAMGYNNCIEHRFCVQVASSLRPSSKASTIHRTWYMAAKDLIQKIYENIKKHPNKLTKNRLIWFDLMFHATVSAMDVFGGHFCRHLAGNVASLCLQMQDLITSAGSNDSVDGSEIPRPTTVWMYKNPVNNKINYHPQLVSRIS